MCSTFKVRLGESTTPPVDPICGEPVDKAGYFCGAVCWIHWHHVAQEQDLHNLEAYVTLQEQPWYRSQVEVEQ